MISVIFKHIYRLLGWKLIGRYPREINKKVLIVAPHTSSWDFIIGIIAKLWLKMDDVTFYGKKELFSGLKGWILTKLGGLPIDRRGNLNLVQSIVRDFDEREKHTILLTPEGTRKKVTQFKTGFYHIAHGAGAAIIPIVFDFGNKIITIREPFYPSGDAEKEIPQIENIFRGVVGCKPERNFE